MGIGHSSLARALAIATILTLSWCYAIALNAQSVADRDPGAGILAGVVVDAEGSGVSGAEVFITKLQRNVRTAPDGSFQFNSMRVGEYEVSGRAVGFVIASKIVAVGTRGGRVQLSARRVSFALPTVVTRADRGGLSGIVGDSAYRALDNVLVQIMGSDLRATTDASGAFHVPLAPGRYLAVLSRPGYARQAISVTVPKNEGRTVAAWMTPQSGADNPAEAARLFDLSQRLVRANPVWTKFYTREDLANLSHVRDLRELANRQNMQPMNPDCPVVIDGGTDTLPLWRLQTAEIEFVEFYTSRNSAPKTTSLSGSPTKFRTSSSLNTTCGTQIFAWLRK